MKFEAGVPDVLSRQIEHYHVHPHAPCCAVHVADGPESGAIAMIVFDNEGGSVTKALVAMLNHAIAESESNTDAPVIDPPPDGMADLGACAGPVQPA